MIVSILLVQALILATADDVLQLKPCQTTIHTQDSPTADSLFQLNQSSRPIETPLGIGFGIECSWQRYCFLSTAFDCQSAWRSISPSTVERAWVLRHRGAPEEAYALPFMMMGLSARCYFQLNLKPGKEMSYITLSELRDAAEALADTCASGQQIAQGGIARSPGGDNNLDLVMTEYQPRAQCNGPGTFPQDMQSSCGRILESMPVSRQQTIFGPQGDPAAEETTPSQIRTRNFECVIEITSGGKIDEVSWYQLWQESNAIFALCVRKGQSGYSQGLGERSRFHLSIFSGDKGLAGNSSLTARFIA
ncbi:hypothetical protein N7G274_010169 [Stereocaulon virgatum]|uniref:Uncharacterized protein n=1 Tax=Stereocaulon virgatum TaxID=373712 RepID=A0ABR3ZU08_9LECA